MPTGVYDRSKASMPPKRPVGLCSAPGCAKQCRSSGSAYCETHYYRVRRTGTFADRPKREKIPTFKPEKIHDYFQQRTPKAYVSLSVKGHPLANPVTGHIYQHRYVYHAFHGDGPFKCHWCATAITWGSLHIDHLNEVKCDNRIENLVASCGPCNIRRGGPKSKAKRDETVGRFITCHGKRQTVSDWSRETGLSPSAIRWRMERGWPTEKLLSPRGKTGPQRRVK